MNLPPHIQRLIAFINRDDIYPEMYTIHGPSTTPEVWANGKQVLLMCSPNYLGLSADPRVIAAARTATETYGAGTNGSGILSGYLDLHQQLETALARFMGSTATLFFNSVTMANMGCLSSVADAPLRSLYPGDLLEGASLSTGLFCDSENHASLWEAVKPIHSKKLLVYRHGDLSHLEHLLRRSHYPKIIVTDGYFSMSGTMASLKDIIALADRHDALVIVDDAHGTGVLGTTGRGTAEYFGVPTQTHLAIGSTSKALGVRGGFCCGTPEFIKYLRVSARAYMFSGTLPPAVPAAVLTSIEVAAAEPWRRQRVLSLASRLRAGLLGSGLSVMGEAHIVPWLIGDETKAQAIARSLFDERILAPSIRFPAVARGEARIRFMPMATHTEEQIDRVLSAVIQLAKEHRLLP